MLLTELRDMVMLEVGTHIFDDISQLSFDLTKFWIITKRELFTYQKYKPRSKHQNISVTGSQFTFTTDIPDWINKVIPARPVDASPFIQERSTFFLDDSSFLEQPPRSVIWKYESPNLYITENGLMDVLSVHNYTFNETGTIALKNITEVDMPEISESDRYFINLVTASFMISIGRSRRAFTLSDLPIQTDAEQLISEGVELRTKSMEAIESHSMNWDLAIGA